MIIIGLISTEQDAIDIKRIATVYTISLRFQSLEGVHNE